MQDLTRLSDSNTVDHTWTRTRRLMIGTLILGLTASTLIGCWYTLSVKASMLAGHVSSTTALPIAGVGGAFFTGIGVCITLAATVWIGGSPGRIPRWLRGE